MSADRPRVIDATAISSLGEGGDELTYRGYAIEALAEHASFEEVAYLLLRGQLPTRAELAAYQARLASLREPPGPLMDLLDRVPDEGGPWAIMDVFRTCCSFLGCLEPERGPGGVLDAADRLLALAPGLMIAWHPARADGVRIGPVSDEPTTAGHVLRLLDDARHSPDEKRAAYTRSLDASLILYAELAINASTLACRVCASTLADYHSCVTAAVATLRGPLHGGASVAVMELLDRFATPDEAREGVRAMLKRGERIMGFGHAIYRTQDPRTPVLKVWAQRLAEASGDDRLYRVAEAIEEVVAQEKRLLANVDFYMACCYRMVGVPLRLFGPMFILARIAGWSAHVAEQRASNKLIHPSAGYDGPAHRPYVPLEDRATGRS
jgi:2-methylcitrate synthase